MRHNDPQSCTRHLSRDLVVHDSHGVSTNSTQRGVLPVEMPQSPKQTLTSVQVRTTRRRRHWLCFSLNDRGNNALQRFSLRPRQFICFLVKLFGKKHDVNVVLTRSTCALPHRHLSCNRPNCYGISNHFFPITLRYVKCKVYIPSFSVTKQFLFMNVKYL